MINKWCVTRVNYKIRANVEILRELLYDEIYVGNESGSRKQSCLDLSIFNFDQAIKGKRKRKIHSLTFRLFHEQIVVQSSCWTRTVRPLDENLTRPHKGRIPKNVDWPRWKPRLSTSCCREFDGWDKHGHFRHRYPTGLALSLVPFLTNCEFSTRKRISYLLIDIFWISCWIRLLSISIINEESLIIVSSDSVFQAVECKK